MNTHEKALETIIKETTKFFNCEEHFICKEGKFIKNNNIIREPDISIFLPDKTILIIEYKTTNHKLKATQQLKHEEQLFKQYFPNYTIKKYYIHHKYIIEQIK